MTYVRIDTDRGALYGPTFAETLAHFFGQNQAVEWDCHHLAAGYADGKQAVSSAVRVQHRGQWIIAVRIFGTQTVDAIPDAVVRSGTDCAVAPFDAPQLPYWVYAWVQHILT
ncbi:hypothetical protein DK926_23945 [Rhodococcus sp. Eu-32]|uniref:hypothetical protein n=1 Tax=Rhodococcus sp. Eu-32 TaxID=1017319 RepID=UPI000DF15F27|nr:hypothetical protein [Rhodococcus sp. Eu-32]RRQ25328.1 hypothetical protein DK926_23945 [Rhodococcus sp. Eu-32]